MSNKTPEDIELEAKLAKVMYKTTSQDIGGSKSKVPIENNHGISGKFTDHLLYSGMPKNASLNTTGERDRWVNGSRDWMEKLG